ncbi:MAG: GAF domain-containing protein [Bdellovibrionales bacterium]|nr:GAF domain-containing protein [Bdellovibrionales bacterium]
MSITRLPKKNRRRNESEKPLSLMAVHENLLTDNQANDIMTMILDRSLEYACADTGTIFIVVQVPQDSYGGARPAFRYALKFFKTKMVSGVSEPPSGDLLVEINENSIVGYVATTAAPVRVRDAYALPPEATYDFNPSYDRASGYRTKSVLAIPIRSKDKIIGVLQLINKVRPNRRQADQLPEKLIEENIIAFSENDEKLIQSFASHAAVALENAKLTADINRLFESFVQASVTAIEARDPSTSGHSDRVALLSVELAKTVDHVSDGIFSEIQFNDTHLREIRYAALLHDFGKIGVRENILLKEKKLFPHELETVLLRLESIKNKNEVARWRTTAEKMVSQEWINAKTPIDPRVELGQTLLEIDRFNKNLDEIRRGILVANESQILDRDFDIDQLMNWIKETSQKMGQLILHGDEIKRLSVARGTLSIEERKEIESHVVHTYEFLRQIAWTEDLACVPSIAHAHHEKLDGSGYPLGLKAQEIPIQSRIMTISDIYDALTSMDRPYKKAISPERALDILNWEARNGKLDKELLKIFIEAEVYRQIDRTPAKREVA